MGTVTLTTEEYAALLSGAQGPVKTAAPAVKATKRKGKKDPKMAEALRRANQIGRTKSGKMRKGYTQGKIMKKAHQLRRRM